MPLTSRELAESAGTTGSAPNSRKQHPPRRGRPAEARASAKEACAPPGPGGWGGGELGANIPSRRTSSSRQAWPGQARDMKAGVVASLRLSVSREESYVLSGTKQVFPSTYYARDWFERLGGEPGKGLPPAAPVPARSRASNRLCSEKNDASYFN